MMSQKLSVLGLAIVALGVAAAPRANAGEEMIEPNTPAPRQNYAQPQERVYYAPRVVTVGVYPAFGYFGYPYGYGYSRYYGYHRYYGHGRYYGGRGHWGGHHRR
jgi:hypothetical protein